MDFDVEIARLGAKRDVLYRSEGLSAECLDIPEDAAAQGARWPASATFAADPSWPSGWYEATITAARDDGTVATSKAGFVLRAAAPTSPILLELSINTWNAYN